MPDFVPFRWHTSNRAPPDRKDKLPDPPRRCELGYSAALTVLTHTYRYFIMQQKHLPGEPFLPDMSVCPDKIRRRDMLISDAEELYGKELDNVDHEILHTAYVWSALRNGGSNIDC